MRKIDKKNNFKKVNVLVEQRYLTDKGIIKEEGDELPAHLRMYNSDEWVDAQQSAGKDIDSMKGEYASQLYGMEKPYYNDNDALEAIMSVYQSHIQQLSTMVRTNRKEI